MCRSWLNKVDNVHSTEDADALEKDIGWVGYMLEKAHGTRCPPAVIAELTNVRFRMRMAIARVRREQE